MKINFKYMSILSIISIGTAVAGVKAHNNDVNIGSYYYGNNEYMILENAETVDYVCTKGQPCEKDVITNIADRYITMVSGRKGSTDSVYWLRNKMNYSIGADPEKLNFAYIVNLYFKTKQAQYANTFITKCPNVALAQGHWGSTNDWWMFSPDHQSTFTGGINHSRGSGHNKHMTMSLRCTRSDNNLPILVEVSASGHNTFQIKSFKELN